MEINLMKELENLGFSAKQSALYVSLLDLGEATVSEIGKKAGITRTNVYDIVGELEEMGLVTVVPEIKKRTYHAEPPEKLPVILEKQAARLQGMAARAQSVVNMLQTVVAKKPSRPKIKVYEGEGGLRSMYDASLLCKTSIRSFLSADALEAFDPEYVHQYFERRAAKNITIRGILSDGVASREYKKKSKELLREIHLVPEEKMNIVPEVYIYDNVVAVFSIKERLGVTIESRDIAEAFRKLYDLAWERAEEYEKKLL